jgi:hypothetical protein
MQISEYNEKSVVRMWTVNIWLSIVKPAIEVILE